MRALNRPNQPFLAFARLHARGALGQGRRPNGKHDPLRPGRMPLARLGLLPLLALALPLPLPRAAAQPMPKPPPPPLNPAWAFDPNGPTLPGAPAPLFLLPDGGNPFNPNRPSQPQAISGPRPLIPPCRLIVPVRDAPLQPLHIPPAQVPLKNSFGCLSAADAIYGPDGCPRKLCGEQQGYKLKLPPGGP